MSKHRLSPSKLGLAERCAWWARADVVYDEPPIGKRARIGRIVHACAEALALGKPLPVKHEGGLDEVAEALSIVRGPLTDWIATWRANDLVPRAVELGLRMDLESGAVRPYPRRGEPGYERPGPTEIGGELDLVRVFPTYVEIIDLKSGDPRWFTESQLRAYAVLAATFYGRREVRASFLRALKTKLSQTEPIIIDSDELDAEEGRLRRTLRLLPMAEPQPGEHCWLCGAGKAGVCPARPRPSNEYVEPEAPAYEDVAAF